MRKLSAQELAEPDVELYVPFGRVLPDDVKNKLRFFGPGIEMRNKRTGQMFTKYIFPAYRVREWLALHDTQIGEE